jgi:hypothetical protein
VIGGPIGIAAGLAVQGVLGKGLSHVATQRYHVGGTWDKPVITSGGASDPTVLPAASASSATPATAAPAASTAH